MNYSRIKIDSFNLTDILEPEELSKLTLKKFNKGNILYYNESINLLIFKNGKAKVTFYENGEEFILYYLVTNNIYVLEESCVVEFLDNTEIYVIDARVFCELFKNIDFTNMVLSSLVKTTIRERKIIKNLVFESCKRRIACFILEVALNESEKKEDGMLVDLTLSVKEMANFIGAKRQTVSTVCNELIKENIIEKKDHNRYIIHDINQLKNYASS